MLANVLYQQVNLRGTVCHALTNLVEKNKQLLQQNLDETEVIRQYRISTEEVQRNIRLLATLSPNVLSVLFNVFSQTIPAYRSSISDCIKAYLSIASADVGFPDNSAHCKGLACHSWKGCCSPAGESQH